MKEAKAQQVRWGPVDGEKAGIKIIGGEFIPWNKLVEELKVKIIPQVEKLNDRDTYNLITADLQNKKDWIVRIMNKENMEIGGMWFGPNPEIQGAPYDGLIRIGKSFNPPIIWNTFQRYSDGSYHRIK